MDTRDRISMTRENIGDWWASGFLARTLVIVLLVYLLACIVLGFIWSNEPDTFDVAERVASHNASERRGTVTGTGWDRGRSGMFMG